MFVVILRYVVSVELIDCCRSEHLEFLDLHYSDGTFIASGMQKPRTGGVIIAKSESRASLKKILEQDPFYVKNLAEYQIFEFDVSKCSDEFRNIIS